MPVLTLQTLECDETEDRRFDDTRLDVITEEGVPFSFRRNMRKGEEWPLNREIAFDGEVTLRLWDEDRRRDDHLGSFQLPDRPSSGSLPFTLDGARYRLGYRITDDRRTALEVALDNMTAARTAGVWRHIPRPTFEDQIRARVAAPETIDQRQAPLCGPTVITYDLARTNPVRYVHLAREMFETGYLSLVGNTIEVPKGLLEDNVGGGMAAADWMFAATLRNDANAILRVRSDRLGGARGYSLSGAMMQWSREVLGMTQVEDISTERDGELDAIRRAGQIVENGGHAFLQVEAQRLLRERGRDRLHYDHWIPMTTNVFFERGLVIFGSYSWGEKICIQVEESLFCDSFHGVVVASRP